MSYSGIKLYDLSCNTEVVYFEYFRFVVSLVGIVLNNWQDWTVNEFNLCSWIFFNYVNSSVKLFYNLVYCFLSTVSQFNEFSFFNCQVTCSWPQLNYNLIMSLNRLLYSFLNYVYQFWCTGTCFTPGLDRELILCTGVAYRKSFPVGF